MKVSERTALFYLFATMTLWAGNAIVGRMFYEELPPFQLAFWRWVLAGVLVLIVMRPPLRQDWAVIWAHKWILIFIATFGIGCYNTLQYAALNYTTATNVGLIQTAMPVLWLFLTVSYIALIPRGYNLSEWGFRLLGWYGLLRKVICHACLISPLILVISMVLAILTYGIFQSLRAAPKLNQWSYLFVLFVIGAAELFPLQLYEYAQGARMQL